MCAANQRRDADETQKMVTAKSHRITEEQKECKKLEELARADLATVEPALNEAIKVVAKSFSKNIIRSQCWTFWPFSGLTFPFHKFLYI